MNSTPVTKLEKRGGPPHPDPSFWVEGPELEGARVVAAPGRFGGL